MLRWLLTISAFLPLLWNVVESAGPDEQGHSGIRGTSAETDSRDADSAEVVRGEYLVHHVAMCVHCHSPRDEDGTLDRKRLLSGAPMPVKSPFESQQWAFRAPSLRGLPGGWSDEQLVEFLQTGKPPTAHVIRPPMPPYRLSRSDAQSVAAYLKSLDK